MIWPSLDSRTDPATIATSTLWRAQPISAPVGSTGEADRPAGVDDLRDHQPHGGVPAEALHRQRRPPDPVDLVRLLAPSQLEIPGCGVLWAAVIVGETAGVHRFCDKDAYARLTGTAPVPVWSGLSKGKVRLNRGGNRSVNGALHMIAVTQACGVGPGGAYLDKQLARGKDRVAALRLRRRLSDAVFAALRAGQSVPANGPTAKSLPLVA